MLLDELVYWIEVTQHITILCITSIVLSSTLLSLGLVCYMTDQSFRNRAIAEKVSRGASITLIVTCLIVVFMPPPTYYKTQLAIALEANTTKIHNSYREQLIELIRKDKE